MAGYADPASPNYGNYQYSDGSIMCWVPAFTTASMTRVTPPMRATPPTAWTCSPTVRSRMWPRPTQQGMRCTGLLRCGQHPARLFIDKYQASNNSGTASRSKTPARSPPIRTTTPSAPWLAARQPTTAVVLRGQNPGRGVFPAMRYQYAALALLSWPTGRRPHQTPGAPGTTPPARTIFPGLQQQRPWPTSTTARWSTSRTATATAARQVRPPTFRQDHPQRPGIQGRGPQRQYVGGFAWHHVCIWHQGHHRGHPGKPGR